MTQDIIDCIRKMADSHAAFTLKMMLDVYPELDEIELNRELQRQVSEGEIVSADHVLKNGESATVYGSYVNAHYFPQKMTSDQAKKMLEDLHDLQENGPMEYKLPCPRCGHYRMEDLPVQNSLSRRYRVYICNACGMDEALLDNAGKPPFDIHKWGIIAGYERGDLDKLL